MSRVIEKTVYRFNELSEKAKKRARQDFVEDRNYRYDEWWWFEDFIECAERLGIEIGTRHKSKEPQIFFSGFGSQGDGASFIGTYRCRPDAVPAIKMYAPQDHELHRIAEALSALQVRCKLTWGTTVQCAVGTNTSYHRMDVSDVYWSDDGATDEDSDAQGLGDELQTLMQDVANWMYRQLESRYDWYFSDEYVDTVLEEREFDEDGSII